EYRDLFFRKLGDIYQKVTTQVMQQELDACISIIQPEMRLHFERWAEFNDKVINSDSPLSADGAMRYWRERVRRLREETMVLRPYWIYTLTQQAFGLTNEQMILYFGGPAPEKPEV
ncbi:MAG: hypothetical protein IJ174_00530, partial [Clostridia bacterium]|nr:hypothetical protein [Clostridia bacterium]